MTTKKKAPVSKAVPRKGSKVAAPAKARPEPVRPQHSEAYENALREYTEALELLRQGSFAKALEKFGSIQAAARSEPVLAERARTYAAVCARKLAGPDGAPETAEGLYYLGVVRANEGRIEEALSHLDRALEKSPGAPSFLYARAAARALAGSTEGAVTDLRQAVAADARLRFQAANDPDFEKIRDEAAFIDVIEPTPGEK